MRTSCSSDCSNCSQASIPLQTLPALSGSKETLEIAPTHKSPFGHETSAFGSNPFGSNAIAQPSTSRSVVFGGFVPNNTNPSNESSNLFGATPSAKPVVGAGYPFDYSSTPLHSFSTFKTSSPSPFSFATAKPSLQETGKESSAGKQTCKQVCPSCGHTGQLDGTKLPFYTPTPYEDLLMASISAMPIYADKSHEQLRFQHYQLQGDRLSKSTISPQPQLALPIFVLTTYNSGGFGIAPPFGSSVGLVQIGTMPAFALPPNGAISGSPSFGGCGSSAGFSFGLPGTITPFGTEPATRRAASSAPGFGTIPHVPCSAPSPTHNGSMPVFGAPCNTGLLFRQNAGATTQINGAP